MLGDMLVELGAVQAIGVEVAATGTEGLFHQTLARLLEIIILELCGIDRNAIDRRDRDHPPFAIVDEMVFQIPRHEDRRRQAEHCQPDD